MILINLLPHREEKRQLRKQAFFAGLGISVAAGAAQSAGASAICHSVMSVIF